MWSQRSFVEKVIPWLYKGKKKEKAAETGMVADSHIQVNLPLFTICFSLKAYHEPCLLLVFFLVMNSHCVFMIILNMTVTNTVYNRE